MSPTIRYRPKPSAADVQSVTCSAAMSGEGEPPCVSRDFSDLKLQLEHAPPSSLKFPRRELRRHSQQQVEQVAASIKKHGNLHALVVDADLTIVSGVCRARAALLLEIKSVPIIRAHHLSPEELRLFAIADNKLAENSSWILDTLKVELTELGETPGLELELTGFTSLEIENLTLDGPGTLVEEAEAEAVEEPDDAAVPVTRLGDMFAIGEHLIICGSARDGATFERLMGGEKARMVFGDLPYNCKIAGNVSGLGKKKHGEFVEGSGEMTRSEFTAFLSDIFRNLAAYSHDGSIHFQCMDWRNQIEIVTAGEAHYSELKNLLVWVKTNAAMSAFYRSQHELVYVWKNGRAKHLNNFGLGGGGRYRSNILSYPGCNTFRKGREDDLAAHSTVKPTALVADLIRDVSLLGDIVLDPTSGSGTTILAAERVKRRARCIELDPKYVDVTIRRAKERLGLDAIHIATGLRFDDLAAARLAPAGEEA